MSKRIEHGRGTVRRVKSKDGVVRFQALLPRALSTPPRNCKRPELYQERLGPPQDTYEEARTLLDAAIVELRDRHTLRHGLPLAHYVDAELQSRLQEARRKYRSDPRANRAVSTWRSIGRLWLPEADWYNVPPAAIEPAELQRFAEWLRDSAEGPKGEPLSGSFIRNVFQLLAAVFNRAEVEPNPARLVRLPKKGEPRFLFLDLSAQRALFASRDVPLADRLMVGCGMGAGLRVGELLSMERTDVHLLGSPHLIVRYGGPDRAPTKGKRIRRVELFEPGLGFWRLWIGRFGAVGERLVFPGPRGGYQKHWPERFAGWADIVGAERLSSHAMRHTYAVAMLSGSWGYEPRRIDFVSQQLGHRDVTTTQRYYGAYEAGTWSREVAAMTGQGGPVERRPLTALELLADADLMHADQKTAAISAGFDAPGDHSPHSPKSAQVAETQALGPEAEALALQVARDVHDRASAALEAIANGDATAVAQAVEALGVARERMTELAEVYSPALRIGGGR